MGEAAEHGLAANGHGATNGHAGVANGSVRGGERGSAGSSKVVVGLSAHALAQHDLQQPGSIMDLQPLEPPDEDNASYTSHVTVAALEAVQGATAASIYIDYEA